jgi:hypothetical protein
MRRRAHHREHRDSTDAGRAREKPPGFPNKDAGRHARGNHRHHPPCFQIAWTKLLVQLSDEGIVVRPTESEKDSLRSRAAAERLFEDAVRADTDPEEHNGYLGEETGRGGAGFS